MSLPWIHRKCGAKFSTLAEYDVHVVTCEAPPPLSVYGIADAAVVQQTTGDIARHVLETVRMAKKSLKRIMDAEMPYHRDEDS